jgi:hypothetical protein
MTRTPDRQREPADHVRISRITARDFCWMLSANSQLTGKRLGSSEMRAKCRAKPLRSWQFAGPQKFELRMCALKP